MTDKIDVRLESITKRYGDHTIVDHLDLEVRKGQFLSILGPSGCGKTTTLRMIGGFITPDEGEIFIDGQNVTMLGPAERNTSMVFQDYALFPHMSVAQNIGFGLKMQGIPKAEAQARTQEALRMVGLESYGNRKPAQLSGGQRQRVALARSLVLMPVVLLLDEPLGALDAQIRKHMQLELKNLQIQLSQTFVYVTHDQEEAMTMSDVVAIMRGGVIEQLGSPVDIYDSPASLFVAKFIGECAVLSGTCTHHEGGFISSQLGELHGRITSKPFTGAAALCLRPENVCFTSAGAAVFPASDFSYPGRVIHKVFKGLNTWIAAECEGEQFISEVIGKSPLSEGDPIRISFNAKDVLIVPADPVGAAAAVSQEETA